MEKFELFLSCPFLWKPSKICKCWNDYHNHIKPKFENGQRIRDPEISLFCQHLEEKARKSFLFGSTRNWRDAIGHRHFDLVTKRETNVQLWWGTSVECLLRVIRNKHEHQDGFTDAERSELGWFRMINGKYEFDENHFASYWITKIPNLVPFLWSQFGFFKASFRIYYPGTLDSLGNRLNISLEDMLKCLREACSQQLDQGHVNDRFICPTLSCSFEMRTLPGDLLARLLDGSSILKVIISPTKVTFTWNEDLRSSMEYKLATAQQFLSSKDIGTYIFVSESGKIENSINCECIDQRSSKSKVVIFTSKDVIEGIIKIFENHSAFKRNSIGWVDLTEDKRKQIEFGDEFFVTLQSRDYLLRDLLPKEGDCRKSILSHLKGNALNTLLRTHKLSIFRNHEIPKVDQFYRERRFYNLNNLHSSIFQEPLENDVFVVLKNGSKAIPKDPSFKVKVVSTSHIFPWLCASPPANNEIFVADTEVENLNNAFESFVGWKWKGEIVMKNIHFLRYFGNEIFQWIYTRGSLHIIKSLLSTYAKKLEVMSESKILNRLETHENNERIIFIVDQPGMGKSQVLFNLAATMISKTSSNQKVIVLNVSQFVEIFERNTNTNEDERQVIIETIVDIICLTEFETALIRYLLCRRSNVKFEIMLDGLDEVSPASIKLALCAFEIIERYNELPVRVWVTLRDYMLDFVRRKFGTLGYKMDPFSKSEQVGFLVDFWSKKLDFEIYSKHLDNVQSFAKNCIEICLKSEDAELAGIPLQCRMIGEIYEENILELDFNLGERKSFNLSNLYEEMLKRKLEIYIRNKKMLPLSVPSDDPLVQGTRDRIERYLEFLSIKLIFSDEVADTLRSTLSIPLEPKSISNLSIQALEHGVLQDTAPTKFIHRTFAEYLIARYITNFVMTSACHQGNLDDIDKYFQEFLWNKVLALKTNKYECRFEYPTLCHFLDKALEGKEMSLPLFYDECISDLIGDHTNSRIKYDSVMSFVNFAPRFLAATRHCESASSLPYINIIRLLAQSRMRLSELMIFALVMEEYKHARYLIDILDFRKEEWNKIRDLNWQRYGVFHFLFYPINPEKSKEKMDIFAIKLLAKYIYKKNPDLLEDRDIEGKTPLMSLVNHMLPFFWRADATQTLGFLRFLVKLGANIHAVDKRNNSVLHFGKLYCSYDGDEKAVFKYLLECPFKYVFVKNIYFQVLKFFLENGCSETELYCFNSEGCTPIRSLIQFVHKCVATGCLEEWDVKWDCVGNALTGVEKCVEELENITYY